MNGGVNSTLKDFLKRRWPNIGALAALVLTIGSIILAIYFYMKSQTFREPVFLVDPIRSLIVNAEKLSEAPIRVIRREDDSEITSYVTSIRFYFWNNGTESIRGGNVLSGGNVLDTIRIFLRDSTASILDTTLVKRSRDETKLRLLPDKTNPRRSVILDFTILEHNDGGTGEIIYEGNPADSLSISGTIEGVKKGIKTTPPAISARPSSVTFISALVLLFVVFLGEAVHHYVLALLKIPEEVASIFKISITGLLYFTWIVIVVVMVWNILRSASDVSESGSRSMFRNVPESILPD